MQVSAEWLASVNLSSSETWSYPFKDSAAAQGKGDPRHHDGI